MTREEAIANLNMISVAFVDPVTKEQRKLIDDTFDMAIKALEQEPCGDAEQIDYHDDFATALKKINDYEMTRDERAAISILNAYKVGYESGMEDLEQQPCEDAISREAVYRLVDDIIDNLCENSIDLGALESWGREQVMELPSVTQKSGHWIDKDFRKEEYVLAGKCSACGQVRVIDKFCSNCGARMEIDVNE